MSHRCRKRAANLTMRSRLVNVTAFGLTIRPPLPSAVNVARLRSISSASRTSSGTSLTLSEGPMASTDLKNLTGIGHHEPDAFDIGRNLLKKLQPFSADRTVPVGESCEVAIGTRFVVNITGADRIPHAYENSVWCGLRPEQWRSRGRCWTPARPA